MADQAGDLQVLLTRTADVAGPFYAPPVDELIRRRSEQSRHRGLWATGTSVVAIAAIAVGLAVAGSSRPDAGGSRRPVLSLGGPHAPGVSASALSAYRWSTLPAAPIQQRSYAASAWTGSRLLVWGGQDSDQTLRADGASYDPAARRWSKIPAAPISPRADAQAVWVDGGFIVWGGYDTGDGRRVADGARYDPSSESWAMLPPAPVSAYGWAQLVVAGGRVILLSTPAEEGAEAVRADAYDPARRQWQVLPDLPAEPNQEFFAASALGSGDTVLLWRYWSHSTTVASNAQGIDVRTGAGEGTYALSLEAGAWTRVAALDPDSGRQSWQPIWTGRQVLLPGQDFYCGPCSHPPAVSRPGVAIDPRSGIRTPIIAGPTDSGTSRYVWTGAALVGMNMSTLGTGPDGHATLRPGDLDAWDPTTNRWTALHGTAIRGDASGAVTVWTGRELLLWGITGTSGQPPRASTGLAFGPPRG